MIHQGEFLYTSMFFLPGFELNTADCSNQYNSMLHTNYKDSLESFSKIDKNLHYSNVFTFYCLNLYICDYVPNL